MKKICSICKKEKLLREFYKHKECADGHINQCKTCVKEKDKVKRKDPVAAQQERDRGREKYHRLYSGKKKVRSSKSSQLYYNKYPEKYKADSASQHLKAKVPRNHLHHWSYNEEHWKDVIELSQKHHNKAHRFIVYDQERMMYRKLSGELLDTKEKHIEYITFMIETQDD